MATFELGRVERLTKTYDLAALFPNLPGPFTAATVALLAPRMTPTAATVWLSVSVAAGVATVTYAGPDADSTGAVVVPADVDLWIKAASGTQVDTVKVGRIFLLGGGAPLVVPGPSAVVSINGKTGPAVTLAAADVGAATPADLSSGLATKVNSSTYTAGLAAKQDTATLGATVAADATVRAAYVTLAQAAKEPELLVTGAIVRDGAGKVTSAAVLWPSGSPGTFTPTYDASGAVSSYAITYGSPVTKTFTQPTITRDANGAAINIPQIVVS